MKTKNTAAVFALLAALLYGLNIPLSKLLLSRVGPTMLAAFLYLGAGVGLFLYGRITREKAPHLTRKELPYTIGMVVLDIAAPILLMLGLKTTHSANASLLGNFEIVATSLIAFLFFREALSRRCVASVAPFDRTLARSAMEAVYQEMDRKVRERNGTKASCHRVDGLL